MKEVQLLVVELLDAMAQRPADAIEEFVELRDVLFHSVRGQEIVPDDGYAVSDVVFLSVNVPAFTSRVVTLPPAPVFMLDVFHEMGHGPHELERIVGGIVPGGRADESAEELHGATRVAWVDIRVAGVRRRRQQEPAVFLGRRCALQDDFHMLR